MTTTAANITCNQVLALRAEAAVAGDLEMVELCDLAITDLDARAECADIIAAAEAQDDE